VNQNVDRHVTNDVMPKRFPDLSLQTVALNGIAIFSGNGHTETGVAKTVPDVNQAQATTIETSPALK